jgi:acyl dehydratase
LFESVGTVSPEAIEEVRLLIGQPLRISQFNNEASLDGIRHYAHGIGDDNPLWCDEAYASAGPYGAIVAPPTFLYSVFQQGIAPGFPGLQPIYGGTCWTWNRLPLRGERLRAEGRLVDVQTRTGRHAGDFVVQVGETTYHDEDGEVVARATSDLFRIPRGDAGGLRYQPQDERTYTRDELLAIERDVFAEERRGKMPRSWESVQAGQDLIPVVKGPIDRITMTTYYAGAIGTEGYKACELRWKQWRDSREASTEVPNNHDESYYSEWILPSLGHQDDGVARAIGMPGSYDNGPMRVGWMAHLVTNWMSDFGFLRSLEVQIRRPNILGNTTWCTGRVTTKFQDEGAHAVEIVLEGRDQEGVVNTTGRAVVWLPSQDSPLFPLVGDDRRVKKAG